MNKVLLFIVIALGCAILIIADHFVQPYYYSKRLDRETLDISLEKGKQFLLNNQNKAGNFTYEYDFISKTFPPGDSQVRQAGALWGLALIHYDHPSQKTLDAVKKGLNFFNSNSGISNNNAMYIIYPHNARGRTGTVALVALACIEMLRTDMDSTSESLFRNSLDRYLKFLLSLRREDERFSGKYITKNGRGLGDPSPYFDGETLLALSKAAKYCGYDSLKPIILGSAERMYQEYIVEAQKKEKDSPVTKGFYQWGSMSFFEIYTAGWSDKYAQRIIDMAYWMINTHRTLWRGKNTAYAHEGIITAWQTAKLAGNTHAMKKFAWVVDQGLWKLTGWQVGGPIQNRYLRDHPVSDRMAVGGIMNCYDCPVLRIDVTQHQMHAVILARRYIYQ